MFYEKLPAGPTIRIRVEGAGLVMTDRPTPFLVNDGKRQRKFHAVEILGPARFELTESQRADGCGSDWTLELVTESMILAEA